MKKLVRFIAAYLHQTDRMLWLFCLGLSGFSAVLLYGIYVTGASPTIITPRVVQVQLLAAGIGAVGAVILSKFDYHTLCKLWKLHVPGAYGLVMLTFLIGVGTLERPNDRSWLVFPGGITLQPTELLKISFILTFAYHLYTIRETLNRPQNIIAICVHGAIPILLVHFQNDDGTALVLAMIFVCMLFAAGINWKYIGAAVGVALVAAPLAWMYVGNSYQRDRIVALYFPHLVENPQAILYQQYNAKLAIGSGQIWGKGIFTTGHNYVPEMHNDFIFSFIGESLGFVGCMAVLAVIAALCIKLLATSMRALDDQGKLICIGVFAMLSFQTIINIGMNISLIPVIGITLPFVSYGGSSVLASYLGIGLALSVYMHSSKNLFSE